MIKRLLSLLIIFLSLNNIAHADAICNDGWISQSTGSGTCSWHGGVREWLPYGWCSQDCECSAWKIAQSYPALGRGMIYNSAYTGCMEGKAQGQLLKQIIESSGNSSNSNSTKSYTRPVTSSSDKWKCPAGYKRDLADGCVKGFVANLNDGLDAYEKGDYKTAIEHWELLANNGSANAQFYIGKMYEKGVHFAQNDYWAFQWISKAAELGLPDAEYTIGYIYRNGTGVVKDTKQTVKWFKKAAKKGHNKAQFNLGAMYINGDGVNQSMKEAKYWINLALKNGHPRAERIWNDFELWKY